MDSPFFSVITPSWNQGAWINGCITSVLEQNASDVEHIIVDNCSTDKTLSVLECYPHLKVIIEPDCGQSQAINKGFRRAQGEIICWLNADDQYLPGTFSLIRHWFADPAVDVIYGDAEEVFFDGRGTQTRQARFADRKDLLIWWDRRTDILQPAVFFRRKVLDSVGLLREDLHLIMDTEFWWRLSEQYQFYYIPTPLARQQRIAESKTMQNVAAIYEEKARVFTPLLPAVLPGPSWRRTLIRRCGMARRWRTIAQYAAHHNPVTCCNYLYRAIYENPFIFFTFSWWKVLTIALISASFRPKP
jgi:glycosyltransferase involved in cell wall biosynthesis